MCIKINCLFETASYLWDIFFKPSALFFIDNNTSYKFKTAQPYFSTLGGIKSEMKIKIWPV